MGKRNFGRFEFKVSFGALYLILHPIYTHLQTTSDINGFRDYTTFIILFKFDDLWIVG